jgi:geranylgeranyl diphosphate synthase, type I
MTEPTVAASLDRGGPTSGLAALADRVDRVLLAFLADERRALAGAHPGSEGPVVEIERLVRAGGKRLRPILCVLGHEAGGGAVEGSILRAGAALELLHTFALIHDDVMDDSPTRRSVPSTPAGHGPARAVLIGDLARTLADHLLVSSGFPPERLVPALRRWVSMQVRVGVGQWLDLTAGPAIRPEDAEAIGALKAGAYTVGGPLLLGAGLAGAPEEVLAALSGYAEPLGRVFQIRDDLVGWLDERSGKPAGLDLTAGRPSVLLALARRRASPAGLAALDRVASRRDPSPDDLEAVRTVIRSTGAAEECARMVSRGVEEAVEALAGGSLPAGAARSLEAVARSLERLPDPR